MCGAEPHQVALLQLELLEDDELPIIMLNVQYRTVAECVQLQLQAPSPPQFAPLHMLDDSMDIHYKCLLVNNGMVCCRTFSSRGAFTGLGGMRGIAGRGFPENSLSTSSRNCCTICRCLLTSTTCDACLLLWGPGAALAPCPTPFGLHSPAYPKQGRCEKSHAACASRARRPRSSTLAKRLWW